MKILLDTNIWRYVSDWGLSGSLLKTARAGDVTLQIAPAVLYETLRISDANLRNRLVRLMVKPEFQRLMPEAYSEVNEILEEIREFKPGWINPNPDLSYLKRLEADWRKRTGGFWHRCLKNPSSESKFVKKRGDKNLDDGRELYELARKEMKNSDWKQVPPLDTMLGRLYRPIPGWNGDDIHPWRLEACAYFSNNLKIVGSAYRDWFGPIVNPDSGILHSKEWVDFWFYRARENKLPRQWLRWAHSFVQRFKKVTAGSPGDNQIFTYFLDTDVIITADKGLIDILNTVREYAIFDMPKGLLFQPAQGKDQLMKLLNDQKAEDDP